MKTTLTRCYAVAIFVLAAFISYSQTSWEIIGNSNITNNNFIGTTNKVAFKIRTNNAVRMTINPSGNVGIGTTKPKSTLDVAGGITAYNSYFIREDGSPGVSIGRSGANYGSVGYGLTFTDTTDTYRYNISDFSSMLSFRGGGFDFNTAPSGIAGSVIPYTPKMTILQNGRVGIGTSTPTSILSVAGSNGLALLTVSGSPSSGQPVAFFENISGNEFKDGIHIRAGNNTAQGSLFLKFFRPDGTSVGSIYQNSSSSVLYLTTSDKRLKNIIGTSQKGLADLMKIKVYDYSFKSDPNKKVQTGFMAQELYEIFPQAVSKPRDTNEPAEKNPWMVDYGSITPLIIKSVQEQQQMINALKKQNEKLQKQID